MLQLNTAKNSKLKALLIGIVFAAVSVGLVELSSYAYLQQKSNPVQEITSGSLYSSGNKTGYALNKNNSAGVCKLNGGDTIFNVSYHTDSFGRRITPRLYSISKTNFLAFFGCSRIFGVGLADTETLPYFIQKSLPDCSVYNYGVPGYGTNSMYAQIEERNLENEIAEAHGLGIYNITEDHVYRSIGSMAVYNMWGKDMPYYTVKNDSVVYEGSFTYGRRFCSFVYRILWKSYFLRVIDFDMPKHLSDGDIELVAKLAGAASDKFKQRFPDSSFCVTIYPTLENSDRIKKALERNGVTVIDYSKLFEASDKRYSIPGDGHPSAFANKIIAKALADKISTEYGLQ